MPEIPCDFHRQCTDRTAPALCGVPSAKDYFNHETHAMREKYFGGKDGVPTQDGPKMVKLVKEFTCVYEGVLTIHAEGSLAAQEMMIFADADFNRYKAPAKRVARIDDSTRPYIYNNLPEFPSTTYSYWPPPAGKAE